MKYAIGKHPNSRKNSPLVKETKIRNTGRTHFKKGYKPWNKGMKQWPDPTLNPNWKGGKTKATCKECKKEFYFYPSCSIGNYCSRKCQKIGVGKEHRGGNNNFWKGGITPINARIRTSTEYKLWRMSVFTRDNFTCIWCGSTENIQADHIKPFAYFPEFRFAIDNGRTLCKPCHETTDTYKCKGRIYNK